MEPIPKCALCGSDSFDDYSLGFDYESLTCANCWKFVSCRNCKHVWLNPRPAIETLPIIYPPTYYAYDFEHRINRIAVKAKEILDRKKFGSILRHATRAPQSYIDIGCGSGRFLKLMELSGLKRSGIYGLELDEKVVLRLKEAGYQASCERVETASRIPKAGIDLATMFHVIEHVDNPVDVVQRVSEWLSPGGLFAIETPNLDSWDARLFKPTYWGGYHFPRHWHLFSPQTLRRMLEQVGLEVVSVKYTTGHSFWMYSLHHKLRYGKTPHPILAKVFNPLKSLFILGGFTAFDKFRAAIGFKTSAMLMVAKKPSQAK